MHDRIVCAPQRVAHPSLSLSLIVCIEAKASSLTSSRSGTGITGGTTSAATGTRVFVNAPCAAALTRGGSW
jgi:hypothetical protein